MGYTLPKDEEVVDKIYNKNGILKYIITCKYDGRYWYLYGNKGKKLKKLKEGSSYDDLSAAIPDEY